MCYLFQPNDYVKYRPPIVPSSVILGTVISYNPENPNPNQRLLISINLQEQWVNPDYVTPVHHEIIDLRKRLYVLKEDKYTQLHQLLNQYIIVHPQYSIKEKFTLHYLDDNNPVFIYKIIPVNDIGFIYITTTKAEGTT